jgi:hypothetical protein
MMSRRLFEGIDFALRRFRGSLIDNQFQDGVRVSNGLTFKKKLRENPNPNVPVHYSLSKAQREKKAEALKLEKSSRDKSGDTAASVQEKKQLGTQAEDQALKKRWELELQLTKQKLQLQEKIAKLKQEKAFLEELERSTPESTGAPAST